MNDFMNRRKLDGQAKQPDPEFERRLGQAMHSQADQFEPQSGAYVRLQQRLHHGTEIDLRDKRSFDSRILLMAAAVLAVFGMTGYFSLRESGQQVVTEVPVADGSDQAAEAATSPVEVEVTLPEVTIDPTEYPLVTGNIAGPYEETPIDAAVEFLSLIRIQDYAELRVVGATVLVIAKDPDGASGSQVAELDIGIWDTGDEAPRYVVTGARSQAAELTDFGSTRIGDSSVSVTATGTGWFEGQASLKLYSSNDGVLLDSQSLELSGEPATADVPLSGRDHGWIVVQAEGVVGESVAAFSAVPVFFDSPLSLVEYQVAHILVDDPDGGLHIRRLPGSDAEVKDTLPSGALGIHRRGRVSSSDPEGEYDWWAIEYGDGERGWVNARYLVRTNEVSEADLSQVGEAFVEIVLNPDAEMDPAMWPAPNRKPVQVGWIGGLENVSVENLTDQLWWADETQEWSFPEAAGDPIEVGSLRTFLDLPSTVQYEIDVDGEDQWLYGLDQDSANSNFADLASVTIGPAGKESDTADRWVTLYVEQTLDGPVIVGIAVWIWSP